MAQMSKKLKVGSYGICPMWGNAKTYISAGWTYSSGAGHYAIDAARPLGSPIYAPRDGVIGGSNNSVSNPSKASPGAGKPGNGFCLWITGASGSKYTIFVNHLRKPIKCKTGQKVKAGDLLGYTGITGNTTGPHDHIVVMKGHVSWANRYSYINNSKIRVWGDLFDSVLHVGMTRSQLLAKKKASAAKKVKSLKLGALRPGKRNASVRIYQQALREVIPAAHVKRLNPSGVTGYYGKETKELTKWVQINKLGAKRGSKAADGVPGAQTLKLLGFKAG